MTIEVLTATENCADKCKFFEVESTVLYENDMVAFRTHRCINYDKCRSLYEDIRREYGRAE